VGGDVTKSGPEVSGSARIRPHWWAVLAVALSLLALVAAVASEHPGPPGHRSDGATTPAGHRRKTAERPISATPTTTTLAPAPAPGTPTTSATGGSPVAPGDNAGSAARRLVTAAATTPVTTVTPPTTAPSTVTTTTTTGSDAAAPVQPSAPTQTWTGALQQPDDPAASQPFTGVGAMQVSASWSPAVTVSLTVTCPSGKQTKEGSSNVVVVITDATGACDFTLTEMVVQYDAVAYTLSIGPADDG
jgi:hypothetical protein